MRRLILVRHGESRWNAERRIQGQACAGLSPRGHAQAAATAAALAAAHPGADLVVSDLLRTRETIAPLEVALGRTARQDPGLRERSFGDWEERLRSEVAASDPERWRRWVGGEDILGEIGGESAQALADRVEPVLHGLLDATADGATTVAVTHGGPIWNGIHRLLGLAPGAFAGVDNASVHVLLSVDGRGVVLDRWNAVGHLPLTLRSGWAAHLDPRPAPADGPPVGR